MPDYLFQPIAPVLVGLSVGLITFNVRHFVLCRPATVDFFSIVMAAGSSFTLGIMFLNHKMYSVAYADMLSAGLGISAVDFAVFYACYHGIHEVIVKTFRVG